VTLLDRSRLRADCARCAGLCCVVPALSRSRDFAIDKPAGVPCPHLQDDHRCGIHADLRERGFPGCTAYDCFGAGQRVVAAVDGRPAQLAAYAAVRDLHELLWYLLDARSRQAAAEVHPELDVLIAQVDELAGRVGEVDQRTTSRLHEEVAPLLERASALVRAGDDGPDLRRADLAGRSLRGRDLRGADLRAAVLIGADLRGADLRRADVVGADLRAADLRGADLREALHLTRTQVGSAYGDAATRLPEGLELPDRWPAG
jgi:hypothetical protein